MSESLWELKETAKWARDPVEKKTAIKNLSARGEEALPLLEEVLTVTAYDDIRSTCEEAIRSVREKNSSSSSQTAEKGKGSDISTGSSGSATEKSKADTKKEKEKEKDTASASTAAGKSKGSSGKLADLPP
ncbi:hypothetical protein [Candidatus Nitrososphaera evergladensis]|uniref:hypothetical protein n=1 Tax=Candidatus Nitrososphaera evergladensis TaxID=1459637 RepID=UPI0011E5B048|nr:hypothetical protein [Candidatus Nitrososphaera evergladensis]